MNLRIFTLVETVRYSNMVEFSCFINLNNTVFDTSVLYSSTFITSSEVDCICKKLSNVGIEFSRNEIEFVHSSIFPIKFTNDTRLLLLLKKVDDLPYIDIEF